jgi:TatD DNase family protein
MLHSKTGEEIIKKIPIERLLIETDGPFTKRGDELFTPLMAGDIQKELASIISTDNTLSDCEKIISDNFERLLGKDY